MRNKANPFSSLLSSGLRAKKGLNILKHFKNANKNKTDEACKCGLKNLKYLLDSKYSDT
jgi:hypothetical protein